MDKMRAMRKRKIKRDDRGVWTRTVSGSPLSLAFITAFIIILLVGFGIKPNAGAAQFTVTLCSDCHDYPPVDGSARNNPEGAVVGSHSPHVSFGIACTTCHADTTGGETDFAHRDGIIDLTNPIQGGSYSKGASFSQTNDINGTGLGSCSNVYCHSTGQSTTDENSSTPTYSTPDWGDSATGACGTCHEVTVGSVTSGGHDVHLNATGVNGCGDCHTGAADNASSYNSANHVNQQIDVANTYTAAGGPGNGYGTCSTAACHEDGRNTMVVSPEWGTDAPSCTACHAAVPTTGSHTNHLTTATGHGYKRPTCENCHDGAVESTTAPEQHLDGNIDVYDSVSGDLGYTEDKTKNTAYASCSTAYCHSSGQSYTDPNDPTPTYATPTWGSGEACGFCHKAETSHNFFGQTIDSASHTPHLAYNFNLGGSTAMKCTLCHKWDASQPFAACNQCHGTAGANTYHNNGEINVFLDTEFGPRTAYGDQTGVPGNGYYSCSNVYCHSTGQSTTDGSDATPTYTTPTWGTAASGACGTCHAVTVGSLTSGSHDAHLNATGVNGCGDCHTGAANDGSSYGNYTLHVNKAINVANTYSAGGAPGNGYGTCSAASCHDDGTGNPAVTPAWGTDAANCTQCHAAAPVSGSHSAHLASSGVACNDCHDNAVESTTAPTQHLDTNIDVFDSASGDLGYTENKTKGTAYTNCTTASCHDDGTGNLVATSNWGTDDANCTQCHAVAPTTGSHTKHLSTTNYNTAECADCHDGAVEGTTAPAQHTDGDVDVYDSAAGDLGYPQDVAKGGAPYDSCSTAYCHSSGQSADGTVTTPYTQATVTWGSTVSCGDCHETTSGTTYGEIATGSHTKHLASVSSGLVNGCGDCHAGAANNGTAYNSTNHVNRSIEVNAAVTYSLAGAPGNNYGTCSTASCHGSGTPTWGGTVSCSDCHTGTGDVDDYTFNNATTARIDSTEWTTQGHGKAGAPLPLDCAYCHDDGVAHDTATNPFRLANYNAGGNGWNDACYVCHKTGSTGYDPGSGNKTSSVKIDKYHQMTAHSQSGNNGGKFCWDCHDPHGDSNIKMIQARPAKSTDGTYGIPSATPATDVVFTDNTTGTGAGGFARTGGTFEEGICNACHTASAGNPKMQHYTSTSSDSHNSGMVCTTCHEHSGDTTVDGTAFPPSGNCIGCHAAEVAGTRRTITGASGDFVRTSHHTTDGTTTEVVTVDACIVCHGDLMATGHPGSAPSDPQIELMDQDSGIVSTYDISTSAGALESFCVSCHDSDGSLQNGAQPFDTATGGADTNSPTDIGWTSGSMSHSAPANPDACMGCHGNSDASGGSTDPLVNAHGSGISSLLSDTVDGETVANFEEGFCFACHDSDGLASTDIEAMFAGTETATSNSSALLNTRHDVFDADQTYSGAVIECTACHDHHTATSSGKVIADPDTGDGRVPAAGNTWGGSTFTSEFCLDCHDNSFPATITPPTNQMVDLYDRWTLTGGGDKADQHGAESASTQVAIRAGSGYARHDTLQCTDCHNAGHGGEAGGNAYPNLFNLKPIIYSKDGSTPLTPDWSIGGEDPNLVRVTDVSSGNSDATTNGRAFCSTCHPDPMGGNKSTGCLAGNCHAHGESSF
jgi:predicted CxxxxCH...CXXCH cytochrome family protein